MEFLTIVNRSSKNLEGLWNGRHHVIPPGPSTFPKILAEKFREQNPVMGSEDPYTLEKQYLIAIREYNQDETPIEQSTAKERWNRSLMGNANDVVIIKGNGKFIPQIDASAPPSPETGFVWPDGDK